MNTDDLPVYWVAGGITLAWLIIHLGAALLTALIPAAHFRHDSLLFSCRSWERDGQIYDDWLGIRRWKGGLPDGAAWFRRGFKKRRLLNRDADYLDTFIRETCRAELCHWLVLLPVPSFFLWLPWPVAALMIPYALMANVPCIAAQRFNRPRLLRALGASKPSLMASPS